MNSIIFVIIGLAVLSSFFVFGNDEINSDILQAFAQGNSENNQDKQEGHDKTNDEEKPVRYNENDRTLYKSKIHPKLMDIFNDKTPKAKAKLFGATLRSGAFGNDVLDVYIYMKPENAKEKPENVDILARDKNIILTRLSLEEIQSLSSLDSIERITLPEKVVPRGHATSEGESITFADQMQQSGITGNGVTVAVIDTGFFSNNTEISSNILSTWIGPSCSGDITCGDGITSSHGTAVAEIVVDMAPNVDLRLYVATTTVELNNAIDDAITKNVDIITASLGVPTSGGNGTTGDFRDGTSSVALKVDEAESAGILVTIAAGNQGDSHWQGTYMANSTNMPEPFNSKLFQFQNPIGFESVMIFNATASGAMKACLPVTDVGGELFFATWDAWALTTQDYDLFLFTSDMSDSYNGSLDDQSGLNLTPREFFSWVGVGDACLVLASFSSTQNHFFHINVEGNGLDTLFQIPAGSIDTPADARGALSVGAVNHSTDLLEAFSSQGPTDDTRLKPEICGPDSTLTHQTTLSPSAPGTFPGTSASTPHVAGAAALLLEQNSGLSVSQLRAKLINEARNNANYSNDNECGSNSGVVSLLAATSCPVVPGSGDWVITYDCTITSNTTVPDDVIVQNNSLLVIPNGITLDIDFANNNLTVKSGSGVLVELGGKIT